MNVRYLGDAYDYWKGSLVMSLLKRGVLTNFMVDAMATEPPVWKTDDWEAYANLLRLPRTHFVRHDASLVQDRGRYFQEVSEFSRNGDLFLDPDTGVATTRQLKERPRIKRQKYVCATELAGLLTHARLVAVYQHGSHISLNDRLRQVLSDVREEMVTLHCVSYAATSAAMFFFSKDADRIQAVGNALHAPLGESSASARIELWLNGSPQR